MICGDCCFIPEASQSSRPAGCEEDSIRFSRRRVLREKHFARRECVPLGQGPGGTRGSERESLCSKRTLFFWNRKITADRTICGDCCFIPKASQSSRPAGREEDSIRFSRRRVRREKHFARRECVPLGPWPGGTHGVERESPCSKRTSFFWNRNHRRSDDLR